MAFTTFMSTLDISKKMAKEKSLNSKQFELLCDELMSLLLNNKYLQRNTLRQHKDLRHDTKEHIKVSISSSQIPAISIDLA
jgi:hypothetical protein